ncbi:hypothetical protein BpHYR1_033449 [Brachionus plicatilis]|uniref:Uncharacterized protein n=1 Tax=Brachionus plicatilis TaxID=10195 RepID=A0A3M7PW81_BRAPC|nr:hypothetical protein BpHYR1_033449 [Brachionus plicatilis]
MCVIYLIFQTLSYYKYKILMNLLCNCEGLYNILSHKVLNTYIDYGFNIKTVKINVNKKNFYNFAIFISKSIEKCHRDPSFDRTTVKQINNRRLIKNHSTATDQKLMRGITEGFFEYANLILCQTLDYKRTSSEPMNWLLEHVFGMKVPDIPNKAIQ